MEDTTLKTLPEKKNELTVQPLYAQVLGEKATHVLIIGVLLLSVIFMKKLRELKIISYLFIGATAIFTCLLGVEVLVGGKHPEVTYDSLTSVKVDHHLISAFNILCFAFNVQFIVFPAYNELSGRSDKKFAAASIMSFSIDAVCYTLVSLLGILLFGEHLKEDLMDNLATREGFLSPILRIFFSVILILNVPFMFYATKEQSLVFHDEIVNRTVSNRA